MIFFLSLEGFLLYDNYTISLLMVAPLALALMRLRTIINPRCTIIYYGTLIIYLIEFCLLDHLIFGHNRLTSYTFYEFIANIIMISIILKCLSKGSLDNRL